MSDEQSNEDEGQKDKDSQIIVNGTHKTVEQETLTYDQVVRLAFPEPIPGTIYSVTFERAKEPQEGELVEGQHVVIKNGTEFDVTDTGRS